MSARCIVYARVSTDDQRKNNSIPTQIQECIKYIEGKKYTLIGNQFVNPESGQDAKDGIPAFVDDYTSRELNRPGLDNALRFLEQFGFDVVVIHALDRLARDPYIRQTLENEFENRGAKVEFVLGNYEESPEGEVRKDLDATFGKWENAKRVERCNRGKRGKAQKGLFASGRASYGYIVDKAGPGGLVINQEQAKVVKLIFDLYVNQGYSIRGITAALDNSPARPSQAGDGATPWEPSSIRLMLSNTTYVGYFFYNKQKRDGKRLIMRDREEWIRIQTTPIIDLALFQEAQARRKVNRDILRTRSSREYLLSGMVFCSDCGRPYISQTEKAGKKNRVNDATYYRHRIHYGHCMNHYINGRKLETQVWNSIVTLLLDSESLRSGYYKSIEQEQAGQVRQRELQAELYRAIGKLEQRKQRLNQAYTDPDINMSKTEYIEQRAEIDKELKGIGDRAQEIGQQLSDLPTPEEFESIERFSKEIRGRFMDQEPTFQNKRHVLELLRIRIILDRDGGGWINGWFGDCISLLSTTC